MAGADYKHCDICEGKAFYDASLNYEIGEKIKGEWVYPETPYREAGVEQGKYGGRSWVCW